jgi:hypothetical protein
LEDKMVLVSLEMSKDEIAMLILYIDSAMRVVDLTKKEMKSADKLRKELGKYLN